MKNIVVIGAGVVGLSIAYELSKKKNLKVFVLEKNKKIGLGNSIKNSNVIHSGVYYKSNSLKKRLAIKGKALIYKFCKKHKIKYLKIGKIFVAKTLKEEKYLKILKNHAFKNGVKDTKIISENKLKLIEPNIYGRKALLSPSAGIFDVKAFMKKIYKICKKNKVKFKFKIKKLNFKRDKQFFLEKNLKNLSIDFVINSAGTEAIKIAKKHFPKEKFPVDRFVRGVYFRTSQRLNINKIVYSSMLPGVVIPRVDITPMLGGGYMFGPNVQKSSFFNKTKLKKKFFLSLKNSVVSINENKISYYKQGIRSKIITSKKIKNEDFYIKKIKNFNWINLFGIESPGLTSSLSIASYVSKFIK